jgi:hypothetical protein
MKPLNLTPVKSSNVQATGYDPVSQTLQVQFKGGKAYSYAGVPPEVNASLSKADSVGRFIGANIVGKYNHTS